MQRSAIVPARELLAEPLGGLQGPGVVDGDPSVKLRVMDI